MAASRPSFAVMGAGAIGGYFGARLAAAGFDVAFIARGPHLDAIRKRGLRVLSPLGDVTVDPANATDDPGEVGPVDAVLFMVKLYDTRPAARQLGPLLGPGTAVLPFQNGIDVQGRFAGIIESRHLMAGAAYIPAAVEQPGVVRHGGSVARLVFGELEGGPSRRAESLLGAFHEANVEAEIADDVDKALWDKFVMLAGFSAVTGLARLPIGPLIADADGRAVFEAAMREAAAVGRALGVDLDADIVERHLAMAAGLPAGMKSSLLQDLERGRRLEVEDLSGAVVRLGAEMGVPVPVHRTALAALKPYADGPPAEVS